MLSEGQTAAILQDPSDREGWELLLRQEESRINRQLILLGRAYRVPDADLADVKQAAFVRIVLESRRIAHPGAYWHYWERIIRTCLLDFVRAEARAQHESLDVASFEETPEALSSTLGLRDVARYLEGRSRLVQEVGRGLALGESASDTAARTGTTLATVYVLRARIRSDLRRLAASA
jgi:DNA-directed RNA polymerase specialized sigma24 family protein